MLEIIFNKKKFKILITVNKPKDEEGYHYNLEMLASEKISGNEFQKLRRYLEDEGYIDEATNTSE
jgi:hypothetical protein